VHFRDTVSETGQPALPPAAARFRTSPSGMVHPSRVIVHRLPKCAHCAVEVAPRERSRG